MEYGLYTIDSESSRFPCIICFIIMSTSLDPEDAVEAALSAAITMNTCRLPDPDSLRKTTRERNFGKQKYDAFKRKSFYDLALNTEQGQITLLGESELSAQCHLNFGKMLEATPAM